MELIQEAAKAEFVTELLRPIGEKLIDGKDEDEAARLTFTYLIRDESGRELASGRTIQLFTDTEGQLILTRPAHYEEFLDQWSSALQG